MTTAAILAPPPPLPLPLASPRPAPPITTPDWPVPADYGQSDSGQSGTLALPLAEFGKSLSDADLDAWFEDFAERNSDSGHTYAITHQGELLIMPPTGNPGVFYEGTFFIALSGWTDEHGGIAVMPTARFILPDGSRFGLDAAWISAERRHLLRLPDNRPFIRLLPDFIAEVQSPSNSRRELVDKINLFLRYGTKLAWLLDPLAREVVIFRPNREPETLYDPEFVYGDADVLPGFRFAVRDRMFDYMNSEVEV